MPIPHIKKGNTVPGNPLNPSLFENNFTAIDCNIVPANTIKATKAEDIPDELNACVPEIPMAMQPK